MILSLLLPWFPILLGVGVGARLLGRTRGLALGLLCALFWVVLVQASMGYGMWRDLGTVVALLSGAIAIVAMGGWSGEMPSDPRATQSDVAAHSPSNSVSVAAVAREVEAQQLATAVGRFSDWLDEHRDDPSPWPKFDEFVRSILFETCKATHVRTYRLRNESDRLVPLQQADPLEESSGRSVRTGIVGHVMTTGRAFVAGDPTHGDLVDRLAEESAEQVAWCFAVRGGGKRLGVVVVGHLDVSPDVNRPLLKAMSLLVDQFWSTLHTTVRGRCADQCDPVSGLSSRLAFFERAEAALVDSYRHQEPVAVAVVGVEGLRDLMDAGHWDLADELVAEVAGFLRRKVRLDDVIGRFDESRFVILLRRADSELASLIVNQIATHIAGICTDESRWSASIVARFGVVGTGLEQPPISDLVAGALGECRRARVDQVALASDLGSLSGVVGGRE